MSTLSITKTYVDGSILLEADLDNIINDVETFINTTKINDDNIQNAGITASSKLIDSSISTAKIADSAVTTAKIADSNVTTAKIADDAVTAAKIADTAIIGSSIHSGFIGQVVMMHTFNGTVSIPRGWMQLNGNIVNQTNYDATHGAGAYTADGVASSSLLTKYLPNMDAGRYPVGTSATTQTGGSAITAVGNTSHQVDSSHTHTTPNHIHQIYGYSVSASSGQVFNGSGAQNDLTVATEGGGGASYYLSATIGGSSSTVVGEDLYTSNASPTTNSGGSSTLSVQPESIEFIYIMKVV